MQFSLRRMLGWITLACALIGVSLVLGPDTSDPLRLLVDFVPGMLRMSAALLLFLAGYAALDPWLGYPSSLKRKWPQAAGESVHIGPVTIGLTIAVTAIIGLPGFLMMLIAVEGGLSFDTGGASMIEWIVGAPLVVWGTVSIGVVGASIVGLFVLFCGSPLGRGFARLFCLCIAVLLGTVCAIPMSWLDDHIVELTGKLGTRSMYTAEKMIGNPMAGSVGGVVLLAGWFCGRRYSQRLVGLGRQSRRWSARSFLVGGILGFGLMALLNAIFFCWQQPYPGIQCGGIVAS